MARTVLQIRKGLCLEMAEAIERAFGTHPRWDADQAARILESRLPLTYAEAEKEWEDIEAGDGERARTTPAPFAGGVFAQLRAALGLAKEIPLLQVLKAAVERLALVGQLADLVRAGERFRNTPIVDDDFPVLRDAFDLQLQACLVRLKEKGL